MSVCMPDVFALSGADVVMPVVPMFHVAAWGLPYAAPLVGAKLVLPGPKLDGASLHDLITREKVTCTAGVPTVWMAMLDWVEANHASLAPLNRVGIGGSACPSKLAERFEAVGIEVIHAWGMTETSPVAVANRLQPKHRTLPASELAAHAAKQGRPIFGVETRVVDDDGQDVPADGVSYGMLLVRGPWIASGYFGDGEQDNFAIPGWFATGDVVTVDSDGTIRIVDRSKDVIKSGGEWISSITLENIAISHPAVREAAAVAVPDVHWGERPLVAIVLCDGASATRDEIIAHFQGKIAKWAIPSRVEFVSTLPHTATGKLSKRHIRAMFA
jgi:fatty-acyl-CoA synthase